MVENLSCEFRPFHYVRGNRIRLPAGSSSKAQEMTHADAFPPPPPRRRDPLDAQSGSLAAGALASVAGTGGARHRRFRVRAGAGGREQGRQGALPDAAAAPDPVPDPALIANHPKSPDKKSPNKQPKENCYDPLVPVPSPRPFGRRYF